MYLKRQRALEAITLVAVIEEMMRSDVRKVHAYKAEYSSSVHNAFVGDLKVLGNLMQWLNIKWFAYVTERVIEWSLTWMCKPVGKMVADTGKNNDRIK